MPFDLLITGGIILTMEPGCMPFQGAIGISNGKIEAIWEGEGSESDAHEFLDARGMIVLPGLINGHVHGDMTIVRGLLEDLTLQEQNRKVEPFNYLLDILSDEVRIISRKLTYAEALKGGTTFLCENMYWSLGAQSVQAMKDSGIRGALVEDARPDFTQPDRFFKTEEMGLLFDLFREEGFVPVIGGIAEEDFSIDRLKKLRAIQEQTGALLTMHLAETNWRLEAVQQMAGITSIHFLEKNGLLSDRLIGSHAVWVDDDEIEMLSVAGVKVVSTPVCEMKIADGIAPIPKYLQKGITVGLGTDGALWNNSSDLFGEMKTLALLHKLNSGVRSISARQALEMATIQGATVFGIQDETGSLREGKRADIILLNANQLHMAPLRWKHLDNVFSMVVFCATANDVEHVILGGEPVVFNNKLLTLDERELLLEVETISESITNKLPKEWL